MMKVPYRIANLPVFLQRLASSPRNLQGRSSQHLMERRRPFLIHDADRLAHRFRIAFRRGASVGAKMHTVVLRQHRVDGPPNDARATPLSLPDLPGLLDFLAG